MFNVWWYFHSLNSLLHKGWLVTLLYNPEQGLLGLSHFENNTVRIKLYNIKYLKKKKKKCSKWSNHWVIFKSKFVQNMLGTELVRGEAVTNSFADKTQLWCIVKKWKESK